MTEITALHDALLVLGLEDWIPLPEAISDPEVLLHVHVGPERLVSVVGQALIDLLRWDRIQVWTGHWEEEPVVVSVETAELMLLDERRYSFESEATGRERVYFVNVENFRA